jgi:ABC-2 type transport system ATP-binding protein
VSAAIEAIGLGKQYGSLWALRDCYLNLPAGRVVALVGPNGAGKSTLLSLVMGLTDPTCGSVAVAGGLLAGSEAALAQVAFLAQDHALYRRFSVGDLLHLGRSLNTGFDDAFARRRLDELGIPIGRPAGKLSGGQQAQVALTLALAKRASILLLDEPVASLDPLARRDFMALLMTTVADTGTTVVLSSHVVSELERVCDYLVVLSRSEVQVAGDVEELLAVHRRLVGPAAGGDRPHGVETVIERTVTDRQMSLVARVSGPVLDPAWESHAVSLEDLALAYLAAPDAGCLPRPQLSATRGGLR